MLPEAAAAAAAAATAEAFSKAGVKSTDGGRDGDLVDVVELETRGGCDGGAILVESLEVVVTGDVRTVDIGVDVGTENRHNILRKREPDKDNPLSSFIAF